MEQDDRCQYQRVLYGIAAVLPAIREQKSGHIINLSSVAGHVVGPDSTVYAGTKHAVRAISEGPVKKRLETIFVPLLSHQEHLSPGLIS